MQDIEIKEKYDTPKKIVIKIAKEIKMWYSENYDNLGIGNKLVILPLDLPDDYQEKVLSTLQRIYSKGEFKKLKNTN